MPSNRSSLPAALIAVVLAAPATAASLSALPCTADVAADQHRPTPRETARASEDAARAAAQAARARQESPREPEGQRRGGRGQRFTEKVQKVLKTSGPITIVVRNFAGTITVTGAGDREVRIDATKIVRASDANAAAPVLAAMDLAIEQQGDRVEVHAPVQRWREHRWAMPTVEFDVVVPAGSSVDLKSVSGDVRVSGVRGVVMAETVSGDVTASELSSQATLRSVSGDVQLDASSVAGDVSANTVSGDVTARAVKARGVTASTVSGNITLRDASCERATLKSMSGDVEFEGALNRSARYELKSHSGNVRLLVDGRTGFELDASTWSGALSSDLQLTGAPAGEQDAARQRALQGVYGDGSARIEATTFSGNIAIGRQKAR